MSAPNGLKNTASGETFPYSAEGTEGRRIYPSHPHDSAPIWKKSANINNQLHSNNLQTPLSLNKIRIPTLSKNFLKAVFKFGSPCVS